MHPLFFYVDLLEDSKQACLILQRENNFGIKGLFFNSFKKFLNENGYDNIFLEINNFLLPKVLDNMLEKGKVKSVTLHNKVMPPELDDIFDKGWLTNNQKMESKTEIMNSNGVPVLNFIRNKFGRNNKADKQAKFTEVDGLAKRFEEISFKMTQDGSDKTYYLFKQNKSLPDLDVTKDISFNKDSTPTIESLKVSAEKEILEMKTTLDIRNHVCKN